MQREEAGGVGPWIKRALALSTSLGVLAFLMVKSGGLGCSGANEASQDLPAPQYEPPPTAPSSSSDVPAASAPPSASAPLKPEYFGGSKSGSFEGLVEPQGSASGVKPQPRFFPGSKAAPMPIREPAPQQQAPNKP